MFLSIFLAGLGLCYVGEKKKGIILFTCILLFRYYRFVTPLFLIIAIILWIYSVYETYMKAKIANGEEKPNLVEDMKNLPNYRYFAPVNCNSIINHSDLHINKNTVLLIEN